jgi:superfamily II DNA or RNA helicase
MQIVKKRSLSSRSALERTVEHRFNALRKSAEEETRPTSGEIRDLQDDLPLDEATAERTAIRIVRTAVSKEERQRKAEIRALNGGRKLLKELPAEDPKVEVLRNQVRTILAADPTDKVIVFTEYLDTLTAIETAFQANEELAGKTVILRGGLGGRRRTLVQERFEKPEVRVLLKHYRNQRWHPFFDKDRVRDALLTMSLMDQVERVTSRRSRRVFLKRCVRFPIFLPRSLNSRSGLATG